MEDFLKRIKLIDEMSTKVHLTRPEFVSALRDNVEESDINNIFSGIFEAFSSNKKKYKGLVDSRGFHIRKKRKFFEKKRGSIHAKGTFRTNGDELIVDTTISAFSMNKLYFMCFVFVCYITFFLYQFNTVDVHKNILDNIPIFFILFIIAIPFVFYFTVKKEVVNMKKDLEKQFNSFSNKVRYYE